MAFSVPILVEFLGIPGGFRGMSWFSGKSGIDLVRNSRVHTKGVVQQHTLLRRVLSKVLVTPVERVLRRVLRSRLVLGFNGRNGSKKGS